MNTVALAALIADFHASSRSARPVERFGTPEAVRSAALRNFAASKAALSP